MIAGFPKLEDMVVLTGGRSRKSRKTKKSKKSKKSRKC